jgi:MFS family permease
VDVRLTPENGVVFQPLGASSLRLLWGAHLVSLCGRWMHAFALGWVVYDITRSSLWLSLIAALGTAPLLPLGLLGGAIADRCDKTRVLMVTQTAAMILALVTAGLVSRATVSPWSLAAVSLAYGLVAAIDAPTLHAYLFEANGEDRTAHVASLQSLIFNGTRVAAPAFAAAAIAAQDASLCFLVNAVSFLPLIVVLRRNGRGSPAPSPDALAFVVRGGFGLVVGKPHVMRAVVQVVVLNVFAVPCLAFLPALTAVPSRAGLWSLGVMTSSLGVGALLAAVGLQIAPTFVGSPLLRLPSALALCAGLFGLAAASGLVVQAACSLVAGAAIALALAHANFVLQDAADGNSRGRLAAWYLIALSGTSPIGHLVVGFWSAEFGVPQTLQDAALVCGAAILVAECLFALFRQDVAAPDRPAQECGAPHQDRFRSSS